MQQVATKQHQWTEIERDELQNCESRQDIRGFADKHQMGYAQVLSMFKHLSYTHSNKLPIFNYTVRRPLRALFTRCPVCGGTTSVNQVAYCRSCCSQWNPITLDPMDGLHEPDRI